MLTNQIIETIAQAEKVKLLRAVSREAWQRSGCVYFARLAENLTLDRTPSAQHKEEFEALHACFTAMIRLVAERYPHRLAPNIAAMRTALRDYLSLRGRSVSAFNTSEDQYVTLNEAAAWVHRRKVVS